VRYDASKNPRESPAKRKYWEIIADNLKKAGWSLGYVSAVDSDGRTVWIADAHRDDGKRFNWLKYSWTKESRSIR
jgi:hypothetical protein